MVSSHSLLTCFLDQYEVFCKLMLTITDYLKSTLHRVSLPPLADRFEGKERMTRERYSIVYFNSTDPDLVIECLRPDEKEPRKYDPITQREYGAMRARMQYPKKIA
jgi:isopenicillin N synthase-like dioxygenase